MIFKVNQSASKLKRVILAGIIFTASILYPQDNSLWTDQNPYSSEKAIITGSIIRVIFKDNIKTEFSTEIQTDDNHTIKTNPDKKFIPEIKPFTSDKSFVKNNKGKYKTTGNIQGSMSVVVTRVDENTGNYLVAGTKDSFYDNEKQTLRLTGIVSMDSVKNRTVISSEIANLRLEFSGKIAPKNLQDPDIKIKQTTKEDGTVISKAELDEDEKQQIILKYIKRLLGESE